MATLIDNVSALLIAPKDNGLQTLFFYLFMMTTLIGSFVISIIVLYLTGMWIQRQLRLRRRRNINARIRKEAIELGRLGRIRADLLVLG